MSRKIIKQTERTEFNHETGEIKREVHETTSALPPGEPPYVKMYINDLSAILDIKDGPRKLMYELARRMDYEGYITLNSGIKKIIRANLPVTKKRKLSDGTTETYTQPLGDGAFRNYLSELCKKEMLRHVDTGLYEMNPSYFARGKWEEISKRRVEYELKVRYKASGEREISGEFVRKDPDLKVVGS